MSVRQTSTRSNTTSNQGLGTDIKYRALAFSSDYILHRKSFVQPYTLVSIDGQAYNWRDTFTATVESRAP